MFSGCYSLTSVDFSKVNPKGAYFNKIFYDCPNLNFVNFSFCTYNGGTNQKLFNENISSHGTLILKKQFLIVILIKNLLIGIWSLYN